MGFGEGETMDRIIAPTVRTYTMPTTGEPLEIVVSEGCRVRIKVIAQDPLNGTKAYLAFDAMGLQNGQAWDMSVYSAAALGVDPTAGAFLPQQPQSELDLWFGSKSSIFMTADPGTIIQVLTEQGGYGYGKY